MIQLSYEPALDPFHTVFRLLRLSPIVKASAPMHKETLRILDFFLLFPFRIDEITFAKPHQRFRKLARTYASKKPYGEQPESRTIFSRMEPIQTAALETLASRLLIEPASLGNHEVVLTDRNVPVPIVARVQEQNERESDLIICLNVLATEYELMGSNGLKARTHLMEHRYDAV